MGEVARAYGDDGPIVSVPWLRERLGGGVRVVDVRPASAYARGHLPGAFHADLYQPRLKLHDSTPAERRRFQDALAAELRRIGVRAEERVVWYEDVAGTVAAYGVWLLDYAGHGGGAILDGGMDAWLAAGGAVTRQAPTPDPSDLRLEPVDDLLATADEIRAGIGHAATAADGAAPLTIVDTRSAREYLAGTIPTATHLEWVQALTPAGRLRPATETRRLVEQAGASSTQRVVTFCGSGYRAAHTYLVLRALGYPRVANYAPSWNEWGRRPDLPV